MNLDLINDLINSGIAGIALFTIVFLLILFVFQKDIEKIRRKSK